MAEVENHGNRFLIEVCADDIRSVIAANQGGADRVELCACLSEGGVTPSSGMVQTALRFTSIPIRVLIRPRSGDFSYSEPELDAMVNDISAFRSLGVAGFVIGVINLDQGVDIPAMERLVQAMKDNPWTFHRAFDFAKDPLTALETVISLGADTILTSGGKKTAEEGAVLIRRLFDAANGRIDIMAGGGITPGVVEKLCINTRCSSFHLSARTLIKNSLPEGAAPEMRNKKQNPDHIDAVTDPVIVKNIRNILNNL